MSSRLQVERMNKLREGGSSCVALHMTIDACRAQAAISCSRGWTRVTQVIVRYRGSMLFSLYGIQHQFLDLELKHYGSMTTD
jgi:hypothetical protein